MSLIQDSQMLPLFSDDLSLWGLHDGGNNGPLDNSTAYSKDGKGAGLDTFDPLSPESDVSVDDPMPDWMSEKVALSAWLGDEEDIPMAELMTIPPSPVIKSAPLQAEELLHQLLEDIGVPEVLSASPDQEEDLSQAAQALLTASALSHSEGLSGLSILDSGESTAMIQSPASPLDSQGSLVMESPPLSPPVEMMQSDVLTPTILSIPSGGDLEDKALALLNALSGVDQSMLNTEVITIKLPPPTLTPSPTQDQTNTSVDQTSLSCASPDPLSAPSSPESLPPSPEPTPVKRSKSKPRLKNASPIDRKCRKRNQNKEAATRYRIKKRAESNSVTGELEGLEKTNKSLRDKVDGLTKEIQYLKDLMIEVRQLNGQIKTIQTG